MSFWERMKDILNKGIETSKDVLEKAKNKAQELGEKGVLKYEIAQLEKSAEKNIIQLGTIVFDLLIKQEKKSITKTSTGVKDILVELDKIEKHIDEKEEAVKKL